MSTTTVSTDDFLVGTWTFTDPLVPLDTELYATHTGADRNATVMSKDAVAAYYGAVEPAGDSILLLHNDIHRSGMSRQRREANGELREEGRWSSGGQGGSFLSFDPTGRYFVVANAHTGWAVFENGHQPRLVASVSNSGSGPHPRQSRSHPHCAIFAPDGRRIYAADMGTDEVLAFAFDPATGQVGHPVRAYRAQPGSGPRHVQARHGLLYLLNELGNTLVVLRPESDGTLAELQAISTLPADFSEFSHTAHLEVSRDGRHVYASNRGHDSIMIGDLDDDGLVTGTSWVGSGGRWPWHFVLTPDERMLVANHQSDDVAVFDLDDTGRPRLAYRLTVPHPVFVAPAPEASVTHSDTP